MAKLIHKPKDFIHLKVPAKFEDIILDSPYYVNFEMPEELNEHGITAIARILLPYKPRTYWTLEDMKEAVRSVGLEWITTTKNENGLRGTFPKRISQYFNFWKIKLSTKDISEIGNIYHAHTIRTKEWVFDITRQLSWRMGSYGDQGSCYGGADHAYGHARQAIMEAGGMAFRTYRMSGEPRGRAWLLPVEKGLLLFNSYGGLSTPRAGELFANIFGEKKISPHIQFNAYSGSRLYFNPEPQLIVPNEHKTKGVERVLLPKFREYHEYPRQAWAMARRMPTKVRIGDLK